MGIDQLDGRLLELLAAEPRIGVLEASRRLGVARGTVQARLDRLQSSGVIRGLGPEVDPAALGYPVTAFATLEIKQGQGQDVRAHLAGVPEVLELHTITGHGDMLCRLVARSNADLQQVIDRVVGFDGIMRASTAIVMENPVPLRIIPLVRQAAGSDAAGEDAAGEVRPVTTRVAPTSSAPSPFGRPRGGRPAQEQQARPSDQVRQTHTTRPTGEGE